MAKTKNAVDLGMAFIEKSVGLAEKRLGIKSRTKKSRKGKVSRTDLILSEVLAERRRQDELWGKQHHQSFLWLTIIMEEVGEAAKAVLECRVSKYRTELLHAAAVAVAAIECIDDREEGKTSRSPRPGNLHRR